jgi:hypothetical protein
MTEMLDRSAFGTEWMTVLTILTTRISTSRSPAPPSKKKEADASKWMPTPCDSQDPSQRRASARQVPRHFTRFATNSMAKSATLRLNLIRRSRRRPV